MKHGQVQERLEGWILEGIEQTLRLENYPVFNGINKELKAAIATRSAAIILERAREDTLPEMLGE